VCGGVRGGRCEGRCGGSVWWKEYMCRYVMSVMGVMVCSLVPRPFTPPVFDRLQYAKTDGEGLGNFIT